MSVTTWEQVGSPLVQQGDGTQATLVFGATGSDNEADIIDQVQIDAPSTYNVDGRVCYRSSIAPRNVGGRDDLWEVQIAYRTAQAMQVAPPETGDSVFSFDTTGGTQHITQSLATTDSDTTLAAQPDYSQAIAVGDDSVDGVDVVVPQYSFSETHYIDDADVDNTYKGNLATLTGRTNNASFKGFAAGEVLFKGARGSKRGAGDWEITFEFSASPNRTGVTIGSMSVNKKGWEYLWVRYATTEDTAAKVLTKTPVAVYVERVYDEGDFSLLGIGT